MNKEDIKNDLGARRDFWNIPCNPITGYRITGRTARVYVNTKNLFFSKDTNVFKDFS